MGWGFGANVVMVMVGLKYSVDDSVDFYLQMTEKYEMGNKR